MTQSREDSHANNQGPSMREGAGLRRDPVPLAAIDQFALAESIPRKAVGAEVLEGVRHLDEKKYLEPFLREMLVDPNDTPHGPTEIADIITTQLIVRGVSVSAALVVKGKTWPKVRSIDVAHQFMKLRSLKGLGFIGLVAVGNIQDDAIRDFLQTATDLGCDYSVVDSCDVARLCLANRQICTQDGLPFEGAQCANGHRASQVHSLSWPTQERLRWKVVKQDDISHGRAKRYRAIIRADPHYDRSMLRNVIREATDELRQSAYYRDDLTRRRWGDSPAHVVVLFVCADADDHAHANWLCRTSWIDPSLEARARPMALDGDEETEGIQIEWNKFYAAQREFFDKHQTSKEALLESLDELLVRVRSLADGLISRYDAGDNSDAELTEWVGRNWTEVQGLFERSGNLCFAPEELNEYDLACQGLFGTFHDMFLFCSPRGLETWPDWSQRRRCVGDAIARYRTDLERVATARATVR